MASTTTKSKAWTYTTTSYPDTLKQTTVEIPSTPPSPTHIIIKPHVVSLNPVDIQLMNMPFNDVPSYVPLVSSFSGTKIAGRDFSGTVVAARSSSGFSPGDEIMGINMGLPGTGFLSEFVSLDVKEGSGATVIKKPTHLDWAQAGSLPCVWLTAKTSVEMCVPYVKSQERKIVVLGGSSSTGIYSVKLAKQKGWKVLSSCSGRNLDFVRSLGADEMVDYTTSSTAVVDAVRRFKPDAIIDCVGGTETIGLAAKYITIVGDKTGRSTMGGSALYYTYPRMVLRWLMGYLGVGNSYDCIVLESRKDYLAEVGGLSAEEVVIDSTFDFYQTKEAFERLNTGRARGKVVVQVAGKV